MKTLNVSLKKGVLSISLNRPDIHNAFDPTMIEEITQVFADQGNQESVRAILLKGEGKSFCAGADLTWMKSMSKFNQEQNLQDSGALFDMFYAIASCTAPIICKLHGNVFGGGVGLAAVSDIVAAVKETKLCFSETKLGLVPAVISPFVLRKTNPGLSRPYMMTAQFFDEDKAQQMGLVQFAGTHEEVEDFIDSQIEFCLSNGPEAVRETKKLLNEVECKDWKKIKEQTCRTIAERRVSAEGQEGLDAFFQKRKPNWKT